MSTKPHAEPRPDRRHTWPKLEAALAIADRGWPVFPVRPFSKRPAVADWEHQATCDPDALTAWWHAAPYNVGIACGPAGLVVLDLDAAYGHPTPPEWGTANCGADALDLLAARRGTPLTPTYTVSTPNGGQHRYHLAPDGPAIRSSVGTLGWRIDVRGAGGYVVAPGSALRVGGRIRVYTVTTRTAVTPLPGWIAAALAPPPAACPPPRPGPPPGVRLHAWVRAAVAGEAAAVTRARPGTRNRTVFVAACQLGELVGAGVLDEYAAQAALRGAAAVHHDVDGFTSTEADRAIRNGLRRGMARPRRITM